MDREAPGKASHSCMPSKPAVCLDWWRLWGGPLSQLWDGGHYTEGSTGDPHPQPHPPWQRPGLALFPASWNLPSPDAVSST